MAMAIALYMLAPWDFCLSNLGDEAQSAQHCASRHLNRLTNFAQECNDKCRLDSSV